MSASYLYNVQRIVQRLYRNKSEGKYQVEKKMMCTKRKKKKSAIVLHENEKETKEKDTKISDVSIRSSCSFHMNNRGKNRGEDSDSEPDRSNPLWKIVQLEDVEEVKREDSADLQPKSNLSIWEELMIEYEDKRLEYNNLLELSQPYEPPLPVCSKLSAVQYLDKYIFPLLCTALRETLFKAKEWDCLMIQKCRFNGLDYLSELLWNRNPLHPRRHTEHRDIFDIPFVIIWLYYNPRPIFPLSWLWTKEEAMTIMQAYIRRYLVVKRTECSEMRQFWKAIKLENEEEKRARRQKSIEAIEKMFNEIFDKLIADAVLKAEWKIYGCRCLTKPCHCVCKCMQWCKCCNCHKVSIVDAAPCDCNNRNSLE